MTCLVRREKVVLTYDCEGWDVLPSGALHLYRAVSGKISTVALLAPGQWLVAEFPEPAAQARKRLTEALTEAFRKMAPARKKR